MDRPKYNTFFRPRIVHVSPCLVDPKIKKLFKISYYVESLIHEVLNIDESKNQLHSLPVIFETNLLSLVSP
jgi:hypothetical protein